MSDVFGRSVARAPEGAGHEPPSDWGSAVIALSVLGGVALVGVVIALVAALRRGPNSDLGTVSSQWISEHRLGSNQDYSRR
jgi:hypothetical protein